MEKALLFPAGLKAVVVPVTPNKLSLLSSLLGLLSPLKEIYISFVPVLLLPTWQELPANSVWMQAKKAFTAMFVGSRVLLHSGKHVRLELHVYHRIHLEMSDADMQYLWI